MLTVYRNAGTVLPVCLTYVGGSWTVDLTLNQATLVARTLMRSSESELNAASREHTRALFSFYALVECPLLTCFFMYHGRLVLQN